MIKKLLALCVFAMMMAATCNKRPPPVVIEPEDTEKCPAACEHLRSLGCSEGDPLEDGTSCADFCVETQEQGHPLTPGCVLEITSCDQLVDCTNRW